ncbi:MAG: DMT family transporter [Candidatus Paceibacterota bacterium]|jgi:drug/metabolite transporter (DMT)-like permease
MSVTIGITLAFVAMLCFGFGDFLIQKSSRKIGDWETLFVVSCVGTLMLTPFVWGDFVGVFGYNNSFELLILIGCSLAFFIVSLLDFESLKIGKITVVEPVFSTEIVVSALLAYFILKESLGFYQIILVILLISGLILVSIKERGKFSFKHFFIEKGVFWALATALIMGGTNFIVGFGARISSPIVVYFFISTICSILSLVYLLYKGIFRKMVLDFKNNFKLVLTMSVADNLAWIAFVFAMSLAPIGIVVALSESYIIISVMLGLVVSGEKLQLHQKIGLVFALVGAVILAVITT